jgi:hypothetical protein
MLFDNARVSYVTKRCYAILFNVHRLGVWSCVLLYHAGTARCFCFYMPNLRCLIPDSEKCFSFRIYSVFGNDSVLAWGIWCAYYKGIRWYSITTSAIVFFSVILFFYV